MQAPLSFMQPLGHQAPAKHVLRAKEKAVLRDMIQKAVPLESRAFSTDDSLAPDYGIGVSYGENASTTTVWRLLIFDDWGRDVMAPLLNVGDLRELGITLYMHINTERDPVPGAPAIYFCAPSAENIARIAQDCGQELYEWMYINFTAQVPREQLESLAQQLAGTGLASIQHIKVLDRTLNYVALSEDLFSLMLPNSFLTLNKQAAQDQEIEAHVNAVVLGLSHVLLSLQALPVIAHSRTGAAEEVARRLGVRLNDTLNDRQLVPAPAAVFGRPVLLIVDRASDIATALHHPFSYRGLLVDIAGMQLNKCSAVVEGGVDEVFEIDPDRDTFYAAHCQEDFGTVGGSIEIALREYKAEYATLAEESTATSHEGESDASAMSKLLASAPLLAERKRFLDSHTKLAYSFLSVIRQRHLDKFHGIELGVLHREPLDKEEFANLLREHCGTPEDRQRLYLVAYLMCTSKDEEDFVSSLLTSVCDENPSTTFPALTYLKHLRNWSLGAHSPTSATAPQLGGNASEGFGWGIAQHIAKNIASTLTGSAENELPLTKLVAALLQDPPAGGAASGGVGSSSGMGTGAASGGGGGARAKLVDSVVGYDPRTRKPVNLHDTYYSQAIVFALGGGSVAEYDDLKKWEAEQPRKAVSYGCTAMTSGDAMLKQLSALGSEHV